MNHVYIIHIKTCTCWFLWSFGHLAFPSHCPREWEGQEKVALRLDSTRKDRKASTDSMHFYVHCVCLLLLLWWWLTLKLKPYRAQIMYSMYSCVISLSLVDPACCFCLLLISISWCLSCSLYGDFTRDLFHDFFQMIFGSGIVIIHEPGICSSTTTDSDYIINVNHNRLINHGLLFRVVLLQ